MTHMINVCHMNNEMPRLKVASRRTVLNPHNGLHRATIACNKQREAIHAAGG